MEEWRDISGYEGLYMISNKGRIMSCIKWNGHEYVKEKRIINGWVGESGNCNYKRKLVLLMKNGERKYFKVHRLVAKTFLQNPENKEVVNHIDGNPLNNELSNLEWATQRENVNHAWKNGLMGECYLDHKKGIITDYQNGATVREIETKYKCSWKSVRKMLIEEGIRIIPNSERKTKYQIDMSKLLNGFKKGKRNVDLAKEFNTNRQLIGAYKYKFKKENLI